MQSPRIRFQVSSTLLTLVFFSNARQIQLRHQTDTESNNSFCFLETKTSPTANNSKYYKQLVPFGASHTMKTHFGRINMARSLKLLLELCITTCNAQNLTTSEVREQNDRKTITQHSIFSPNISPFLKLISLRPAAIRILSALSIRKPPPSKSNKGRECR
jgi:hypothetical protein